MNQVYSKAVSFLDCASKLPAGERSDLFVLLDKIVTSLLSHHTLRDVTLSYSSAKPDDETTPLSKIFTTCSTSTTSEPLINDPVKDLKLWLAEKRIETSTVSSLKARIPRVPARFLDESVAQSPVKRIKVEKDDDAIHGSGDETPVKRKRGRPRKLVNSNLVAEKNKSDASIDIETQDFPQSSSTPQCKLTDDEDEINTSKAISNVSKADDSNFGETFSRYARIRRASKYPKYLRLEELFKDFRFICHLCPAPRPCFINRDSLNTHMTVSHISYGSILESSLLIECSKCEEIFKEKYNRKTQLRENILQHLQEVHESSCRISENPDIDVSDYKLDMHYICPICHSRHSKLRAFKKHFYEKHILRGDGGLYYECKICNKVLQSSFDKLEHRRFLILRIIDHEYCVHNHKFYGALPELTIPERINNSDYVQTFDKTELLYMEQEDTGLQKGPKIKTSIEAVMKKASETVATQKGNEKCEEKNPDSSVEENVIIHIATQEGAEAGTDPTTETGGEITSEAEGISITESGTTLETVIAVKKDAVIDTQSKPDLEEQDVTNVGNEAVYEKVNVGIDQSEGRKEEEMANSEQQTVLLTQDTSIATVEDPREITAVEGLVQMDGKMQMVQFESQGQILHVEAQVIDGQVVVQEGQGQIIVAQSQGDKDDHLEMKHCFLCQDPNLVMADDAALEAHIEESHCVPINEDDCLLPCSMCEWMCSQSQNPAGGISWMIGQLTEHMTAAHMPEETDNVSADEAPTSTDMTSSILSLINSAVDGSAVEGVEAMTEQGAEEDQKSELAEQTAETSADASNTEAQDEEESLIPYCFLCEYDEGDEPLMFDSLQELHEHVTQIHLSLQPEDPEKKEVQLKLVCDVEDCGKYYVQSGNMTKQNLSPLLYLIDHKITAHGFQKPSFVKEFKCAKCDFKHIIQDKFFMHVRRNHPAQEIMAASTAFSKLGVKPPTMVMCDSCGQIMKRISYIKNHAKICSLKQAGVKIDPQYECKECHKKFMYKMSLKKHHHIVHLKERNFLCQECPSKFFDKAGLANHMWLKHKINMRGIPLVVCTVCGEDVLQTLVMHHMKRHSMAEYPCDKCDKVFRLKGNLKEHQFRIHSNRKFNCPDCPQIFGDPRALNNHKTAEHNLNKQKCDLCSFECIRPKNLERHKAREHAGDNTDPVAVQKRKNHAENYCEICCRTFAAKANFENHMFVKHKVNISASRQVLQCSICSFQTLGNTLLSAHMKNHNKGNHVCNECGKSYHTRNSMVTHKRKSHGPKNYLCPQCSYTATSRAKIERHIARKHTHIHFQCHLCNYTSYVENRLISHLRTSHAIGAEVEQQQLGALLAAKSMEDRAPSLLEQAPEEITVATETEASAQQLILTYMPLQEATELSDKVIISVPTE